MEEYYKSKGLDFQTILYETIQSIGKKALIEFRGGQQKTVIHGDWSETYIEPDSRLEYIQGVEFLSDLLTASIQKHSDFKEKYEEILKKIEEKRELTNKGEMETEDYIIEKLNLMREMFRLLMGLMSTKPYSKTQGTYG